MARTQIEYKVIDSRTGTSPSFPTKADALAYARAIGAPKNSVKKMAFKNPGIPVGKFLPARLNPNGTVSFLMKGKPVRKARNISEGFIAGGVFHPIRHASDYRPEALSGPEGTRARSGARSTTRKKVVKKKATKKRVTRKTAKRKKR